ncbi:MAG: hypothetical protein ACYTBV_17615, partial [Planctomycetota bacterium]
IFFGMSMVMFYVYDNYMFFSSYLTRLLKPVAVVAPLPATSLESTSGDITAEPGTVVTFTASIKGRVPEYGDFILTGVEPNESSQAREILELRPEFDAVDNPIFKEVRTFESVGKYKYRFKSGDAVSEWHNVNICNVPKIKSITADVTLGNNRYIRPYTEQVKDYTLEVAEGSFVSLAVETTEPLSEATVKDLNGRVETAKLTEPNRFEYKFIASIKGFVGFELLSSEGVGNKEIPNLQVMIKADEPAKIKLLSPDGDYLTTDVASVPITFEVSDDFGLSSFSLHIEMPDKEPQAMAIPVKKGTRSKTFTHTIELEEHGLSLGDSIMFYATACDVDTGTGLSRDSTSSDIYFVEIRPYRQRWHQTILPNLPRRPNKQGLEPEDKARLEFLISILEYTRAIVKKTSVIASKPALMNEDKSRLDYINKDVKYCHDQVKTHRDTKFTEDPESQDKLDKIISQYDNASKYLAWNKASSALKSEKDAYRKLRKFIVELEKTIPPRGRGPSPRTRDKVKMEEAPHVSQYDKERVQWEMERLAEKLAEAAEKQKKLAKDFEEYLNFLRQQAQKKVMAQKVMDEKSWVTNERPTEARPCSSCGSTKPGGCQTCAAKPTVEGAFSPPPKMLPGQEKKDQSKGQGEGSGQGQGQGQGAGEDQAKGRDSYGQGQKGNKGNQASDEERLNMFKAQQKALKEQIKKIAKELGILPGDSKNKSSTDTSAQEQAKEHMEEAMAQMDNFENKLTQAYYKSEMELEKLDEALKALNIAFAEIKDAEESLEEGMAYTNEELLAKQAEKYANKLLEIMGEFESGDEEFDPKEKYELLLQSYEALKAMAGKLENMSDNTQGSPSGHLGQGSAEGGGGMRDLDSTFNSGQVGEGSTNTVRK